MNLQINFLLPPSALSNSHRSNPYPSTAEVGQARCFEHRAQYSVAKAQCIINIRYKFIEEITAKVYFNQKLIAFEII